MIDDAGTVLACNEQFASETGVPHALLVGREWWEAFSGECCERAQSAQRAMVEGRALRGTVRVSLTHAEGTPANLGIAWHKLREPGTQRIVWICAVTQWARQREEAIEPVSPSAEPSGTTRYGTADLALLAAADIDRALTLSDKTVEAHSARSPAVRESLRLTTQGLRRFAEQQLPFAPAARAGELVRASLERLKPLTRRHVVQFLDESRLPTAGGTHDLPGLVQRLLSHALHRAPDNTVVMVRTFDEPGFVCIEVHDRGATLKPDALASVNEPFFSRGLASKVEDLAALHALSRTWGGSLRVTNDVNGGLTAALVLPAESDGDDLAPRRVTIPSPGPLDGRKVLLVDDDPVFARALKRLLEAAGAVVMAVSNVCDALIAVTDHTPNVIVTDVQLPDGDGLTLARRLCDRTPGITVFAMTGQTDPSLEPLARSMGAVGILHKPFDPQRLVSLILQHTGG
jgi:CheY-like chemotaxis protein